MKHLKLMMAAACIMLLWLPAARSQSIELNNVTRQGFKGLRTMGKDGYYIQFYEGSQGKGKERKEIFHVYMLDNNLQSSAHVSLELKSGDVIEDLAFNGDHFMLIYGNKYDNYRAFKIYDKQAKEVASKTLNDIPYRLFSKPAMIIPVAGSNDFIVINYVKEKKIGYSVSRYNSQLEELYRSVETPDKQKLFPVDYVISGNTLFVLEFLTRGYGDDFQYNVALYDITTGKQTIKNTLMSPDLKAYGFATFIKSDNKGGVVTGGMYFDEPETKKSNSDGFFAAAVDAKGTLTFTHVDWKSVKDKLKDPNTAALWGGKTKTFVHDVIAKADGGITVIGENYRRGDAKLAGDKSSGAMGHLNKLAAVTPGGGSDEPSEEAVTVSEFVLMEFDPAIHFTGVRKIDKPDAVTIIKASTSENDKPYVGQAKGLNLANILNNRGYMPYRFTISKNGTQYLAFWLRYDNIPKELIAFTPLTATAMDTTCYDVTGAELILIQELGKKVTKGLGALGRLAASQNEKSGALYQNEFTLKGSDDPYDYRGKELYTRVIASNLDGKILIYDFFPEPDEEGKKKGFLGQMEATMNGKLKIWYLDVPVK